MTSVTGLTATKMLALSNAQIIGATVVGGNLILTTRGGDSINVGTVQGPQGIPGDIAAGSAAGGDLQATYPNPEIRDGIIIAQKFHPSVIDPVSSLPGVRTLGAGADQAAAGDHNHDLRTLAYFAQVLGGTGRLRIGDLLFQWGQASSPSVTSANADTWTWAYPGAFSTFYGLIVTGLDAASLAHASRVPSTNPTHYGGAYSHWTDGSSHTTHGSVQWFAFGLA